MQGRRDEWDKRLGHTEGVVIISSEMLGLRWFEIAVTCPWVKSPGLLRSGHNPQLEHLEVF